MQENLIKAAQCEAIAEQAKTDKDRERWLHMAAFWRNMSEVAAPEPPEPTTVIV